jgi:hypothetical protein
VRHGLVQFLHLAIRIKAVSASTPKLRSMALSPARGCSVLMALLLVAVVAAAVAAAPAVAAADAKWAPPGERHGAHSHKAPAPALPSAAAPAVAPPTHGTAAAAPGPAPATPPQGAEAPAPSPDHSGGAAAAVLFAWPTVLLVAAGAVAAATMV